MAGRRQLKSYMWVRRGGPPEQPIILFDYVPSRSGTVPLQLLADFKGTLQTDGYEGYAAIGAQGGIVHAGCLAHARRKFDEALKAQKANNTGRGGLAATGLLHIQGIYRVEREARERNLSPADRHLLRQEKARPLWEAMRSWLDQSLGSAPLSTLTGKRLAISTRNGLGWPGHSTTGGSRWTTTAPLR
jgi:transposase